eukprot:g45622.t1
MQIAHDADVGKAVPIKQHPYTINPLKAVQVEKEVEAMLQEDIIESSQSERSSPIVLVPKSDGTQRFGMDYRKVNAVTKSDSYPIPRLEDCAARGGQTAYITKLALLCGYWQVPLLERAKDAEVTFLGHSIGYGQMTLRNVKMKAIKEFSKTILEEGASHARVSTSQLQAQGQIQAQSAQTAQVTLTKPPVVSVPTAVVSSGVTTLPVTVAGISVAISQPQKGST